jgi:prevent-host-death family protein
MHTIGVRELKNQTSELVRRVREGEPVALTYHGHVIAHIVPVAERPYSQTDIEAALDDLDALAAEIAAERGDSATIDASEDLRREL